MHELERGNTADRRISMPEQLTNIASKITSKADEHAWQMDNELLSGAPNSAVDIAYHGLLKVAAKTVTTLADIVNRR